MYSLPLAAAVTDRLTETSSPVASKAIQFPLPIL
jgi:hypothetical protein